MATLHPFLKQPILLWSHTTFSQDGVGLTLGALPAAGVLRETLEEMEAIFEFVYGMPDNERLMARIVSFARAAAAVRALAHARVGLLGYASMGMYTGTIDHTRLRYQLGPELDHLDQYEVVASFEQVSDAEVDAWVPRSGTWQIDAGVSSDDLRKVLRMAAAVRHIANERRWDALTIKCQYELSRTFGLAPCLPLSILGDELVCSCEGDVPLVSKHTALYAGLLNSSPYRPGRVTLARLSASKGRFKMHIATGEAELPPPFHEVGCPTYPFVNVAMDMDPHAFMQRIGSQHYAIAYGDVRQELATVCRLLDIEIV